MNKLPSAPGVLAGAASVILWIVFNFLNPYSGSTESGPMSITFFFLFLPACLAVYASFSSKNMLMFVAFVWSLPLSIYCLMTPGIFALFGLANIFYLISFVFMRLKR